MEGIKKDSPAFKYIKMMSSNYQRKKSKQPQQDLKIKYFLIFVILLTFFLIQHTEFFHVTSSTDVSTISSKISDGNCLASFGTYQGSIYTTTASSDGSGMTTMGQPKCLIESKWMKLMQHTVQIQTKHPQTPQSSSSIQNTIIDDWLFIDYHDRINVLVQDPLQPDNFLIMNQTKYSLEAKYSLAIVGGIIEPNESADHAAHREVKEEMDLSCLSMKSLGRFRTDVNRGMGWVHSFLATECSLDPFRLSDHMTDDASKEEVGAADMERQQFLSLSKYQLKESVLRGEFMEVQWSNTVSLALLHLS